MDRADIDPVVGPAMRAGAQDVTEPGVSGSINTTSWTSDNARYSGSLVRSSSLAVEGDSTSNTACGSPISLLRSPSSAWRRQKMLTSGKRIERGPVRTARSEPKGRQPVPRRRGCSEAMMFAVTPACSKPPPAIMKITPSSSSALRPPKSMSRNASISTLP